MRITLLMVIDVADDAQDPCKKVDCGQGNCVVSSASLLGFDCLCKPGWSKMQLGFITFPACTIPNCESLFFSQIHEQYKKSLCTLKLWEKTCILNF